MKLKFVEGSLRKNSNNTAGERVTLRVHHLPPFIV